MICMSADVGCKICETLQKELELSDECLQDQIEENENLKIN